MQRTFYVKALWDDEVNRWYSESDIDGLHIETDTLDEFEEVIKEHAVDLIIANHFNSELLKTRSLADLVPGILWQRPQQPAVHA